MPSIDVITGWINSNILLTLSGTVFLAVVCLTLAITGFVNREQLIRRRALQPFMVGDSNVLEDRRALGHENAASIAKMLRRVSQNVKPTSEKEDNKLRLQMRAAGFFDPQAVNILYACRLILGVGLPLVALIVQPIVSPQTPADLLFMLVVIVAAVGFFLPNAYLNHRVDKIRVQHRNGFPDFLDLLVVSTEAGISIEAAIDRVGREMAHTFPHLAAQLYILNLELRAGRAFHDALQRFADNVGIEEAKSFARLIQQSQELGSSLVDALRVYSDEMRDKRLARAEEKAHALPAKLVIPLGLFIFPIMLVVCLMPVIIRINAAFF
jgi:tight adherence protein C